MNRLAAEWLQPRLRASKRRACVLDIGSLDVNGNNRCHFIEPREYVGVDVGPGANVDVVSLGTNMTRWSRLMW